MEALFSVEEGKDLGIHIGDKFILKFKELDEEDIEKIEKAKEKQAAK